MSVSLLEALKAFVDEQGALRGHATSSEHIREFICKDQAHQRLRNLLLSGAASTPTTPSDAAYFSGLRKRLRPGAKPRSRGW